MPPSTCQVFEVARGSTHDGPGMRTTIFLKGCPLRCLWCQNPEGISAEPDIVWEAEKCIRCLDCVRACPESAIAESPDGLTRDRSLCTRCGACVEVCASRAMDYTARRWDMDSLVAESIKDLEYYRTFGGGVTVSGGEPLRQYRFVSDFFERLHELGVHTALDTCGMAPKEAFDAVLPYTDHVLFDLKMMDADLHLKYTGQSNALILKNLQTVAESIRTGCHETKPHMMRLWIRTPLIPGATATTGNLCAIGSFILEHLADLVNRWKLCDQSPITPISPIIPIAELPRLHRLCGVVRASDQRRAFNVGKAHRQRTSLEVIELLRGTVALYRRMV